MCQRVHQSGLAYPPRDDLLLGGLGFDTVYGLSGVDQIYGGADGDQLNGGSGADFIYAEDGNDRLYGDDGDDYLVPGAGLDDQREAPGQVIARQRHGARIRVLFGSVKLQS